MTTNDEITKRIAALELENAKLKTQLVPCQALILGSSRKC